MNVEFKRDVHESTYGQKAEPYDLEKILSIELIREHTKTDDVLGVTDQQLELYRKAALEAASSYTGFLLTGRKIIQEDVVLPEVSYRPRFEYENQTGFEHKTKYLVSDNYVFYYGVRGQRPARVMVKPDTNLLLLPKSHFSFGLCHPESKGTALVQYVAGFSCEENIPGAVALGALKYITHVMMNPGDNTQVTNLAGTLASSGVNLEQANNPAWASGAIEIWRSAVPDLI